MKIKKIHPWLLTYKQAIELQKELASKLVFEKIPAMPTLVAGVDCAFSRDKKRVFAALVVLKLPDFEIIEETSAAGPCPMPYIPGLLSFREAPVCIQAVEKLKNTPDCFLIDGQGIAHPRRLGIAAHLGLFFDKPTIGCAKSRLIGEFTPPQNEKGSASELKDHGETIGAVLRTRKNVKPLFISPGHLCTLEDAIKITLTCTTKYRLPEPTRLAHQKVTLLKYESD